VRNATRLPVTGSLGPDVSYVSSPHLAVIAYSPFGYVVGAARLAQQSDGRWTVDVATVPVWRAGVIE